MIESVELGDELRATSVNTSRVHALGFTHHRTRRVLLINKGNSDATVTIDGATSARVVDERTHQGPPREETLSRSSLLLGPYATAVVQLVQQ